MRERPLPLIIIGGGKSLQLKDVKLVHAASLPCLYPAGLRRASLGQPSEIPSSVRHG